MQPIQKVGIIGSGVMGAGIAAQAANAGVEVVLLDICLDGPNPNVLLDTATAHMEKAGATGALMSAQSLGKIQTGNLTDDLSLLSDCDWVIEVVIEKLDIKRQLYLDIESVRKEGSVISSNTSTIPLANLMQGMPESLQACFMVTHFFNPPRHMRLLEIVAGPKTQQASIDRLSSFCDKQMGKTLVECKDRPGFIANRLGVYWMQCAASEAINLGLKVEDADAIMSKPCGFPKTGVFGLFDLVGIDLMPNVAQSLAQELNQNDAFQEYAASPDTLSAMVAKGLNGRKSGAGFYRMNKTQAGKVKEAYCFKSASYRKLEKVSLKGAGLDPKRLRTLMEQDDLGGKYAWAVLSKTLSYAIDMVGDACDDITGIDEAMRLGYNWRYGPFELIDLIGGDWLAIKLEETGQQVPALLSKLKSNSFYKQEHKTLWVFSKEGIYESKLPTLDKISIQDLEASKSPRLSCEQGRLWDLGDKVYCLESRTKMNVLSSELLDFINQSIEYVSKNGKALVLYNEGAVFAAGANLEDLLCDIENKNFDGVRNYIRYGQQTFMRLKYSPFPVVGAPAGAAYGGGVELLLHCDAVQAHSECYLGLVETNIGIIPGWGGCKEILTRFNDTFSKTDAHKKAFDLIRNADVSASAYHAKEIGYLQDEDAITMNRARLLADAKSKALSMLDTYVVQTQPVETDCDLTFDDLSLEMASHDMLIDVLLKRTLDFEGLETQTSNFEWTIMDRELAAIDICVMQQATQDRIRHMLKTGKPLEN